MTDPTRIPLRQLDLGSIGHFQVNPEPTPGNQVEVQAGILYAGGHAILDQSGSVQTTPAFAPVTGGPGDEQRYDLVYLGATGAAAIQQGTGQSLGTPFPTGGPGSTGGPALLDNIIPIAYVFIDETGAVVVDASDIFPIGGQFNVTKDLVGYLVDKGLYGSPPAGTSDDVSALFAAEIPGGSSSQAGVVTTPALNYVHLLDQKNDQILHGTGAEVYGRLTEAASVWTLSYYYQDAAGAEQAIDPSTLTPAPSDVRLMGVPKVYSQNDPTRPLFPSSIARISDQIAGDIPYATTSQAGKVQLVVDGGTTATHVPQATDSRLGRVTAAERAATSGVLLGVGTPSGLRREVAFVQGTGSSIAVYDDSANDRVVVEISNSGAFPGYYASAPPADSGAGSAGASALVSRGDHQHPKSTVYQTQTDYYYTSGSKSSISTGALGFTPFVAFIGSSANGNARSSVGIVFSTSNYGGLVCSGAVQHWQIDRVAESSASVRWYPTAFGSSNVTITAASGSETWDDFQIFTLGYN